MLFICSHNIETMECAVVASSELLTQASGCFILNKHQMVLFLTLTKLWIFSGNSQGNASLLHEASFPHPY